MKEIIRFIKSFKYAFSGVMYAFRYNHNVRIIFSVGIIVVLLSLILDVNPFEMGILGVMILLVICAEMINTAIEQMVNLITVDYRQQAKIAKDVAAGMVLITALGSIVVGILIFTPHILKFIK